MQYNKEFFKKVFSDERMERYFVRYPDEERKAVLHYMCNLRLSEAMYIPLSVFEVALRNALCRELHRFANREDWYTYFKEIPELDNLNKYIDQAIRHINNRGEKVTSSKVIAELTLGFWVSLFNSEYERILWKDLRRAFPYMPKNIKKRKNISSPLNGFRAFRNRVFHNEAICWNIKRVKDIHDELVEVLGWINKDLPGWILQIDRFDNVCQDICKRLDWDKI